jgi:nitrous oxide reductase
MSDLSRRDFLRKSSIGVAAGAAAAGGLLGAGKAAAATKAGAAGADGVQDSAADPGPASDDVVVHVRKGEGTEVHLMVGEREIVSRDPQLAKRIIRASKKSK